MKLDELPKTIPIFPLSNFIMFPGTTVPLNIFEPRYLQMVNDSMKRHRMIGMIQPKKTGSLKKPDLYEIGCIGKITSFNDYITSGHSSVVERLVANEKVVGSSPIARSIVGIIL